MIRIADVINNNATDKNFITNIEDELKILPEVQ